MAEFDRGRWTDPAFQRPAYAAEMALRFVWACQRQINRFTEGFSTRPDLIWDLSKGIVAPIGAARTHDLYQADGYLVLLLAWQAVVWLRLLDHETARDEHALDPALVEKVKVLRDVYEHWDEQIEDFRAGAPKSRSGPKFKAANPELAWPGDGWKAHLAHGATMDNLPLKDLYADLARVEKLVLTTYRDLWASIGLTLPDGNYEPLPEWRFFAGAVQVEE